MKNLKLEMLTEIKQVYVEVLSTSTKVTKITKTEIR